jgi:hypothetical protein
MEGRNPCPGSPFSIADCGLGYNAKQARNRDFSAFSTLAARAAVPARA